MNESSNLDQNDVLSVDIAHCPDEPKSPLDDIRQSLQASVG